MYCKSYYNNEKRGVFNNLEGLIRSPVSLILYISTSIFLFAVHDFWFDGSHKLTRLLVLMHMSKHQNGK